MGKRRKRASVQRPSDTLEALRFESDRTGSGWVPVEGKGPLHISRLRKLERAGLVELERHRGRVRDQAYSCRTRPSAFEYTVARPVSWVRPDTEQS
jgi:hypothetical protein